MPKVFLCHSSSDKPFARRLDKSLRAFGIGTWLDEAEILPGQSLIGKIEEGLAGSDYLIAILSPSSVTSEWCKRELRAALTYEIAGRRLAVLPIIAERCEIPAFIADKLYVDFTGDYAGAISKLLTAFIGRGDTSDIPPPLIQKWLLRFEYRHYNDFDEFVRNETEWQEMAERRRFLLSQVTLESLSNLSSTPLFDRDAGALLERLADAYESAKHCSDCGDEIIDADRLSALLRQNHRIDLSVDEIITRLSNTGSRYEAVANGYQCEMCFYYRNQGAD